jgi:hypothetical protein
MDPRKVSNKRVPLVTGLYRDLCCAQLCYHGIQIIHPKIQHLLLAGPAELVCAVGDGCKDGGLSVLYPCAL